MTSNTCETLALFIEQHAIAATLVQPDRETPTVALAALALGCQTDQIVKSVLFLLKDGQQAVPVLVITNGTAPIDFRKLADLLQVGRKRIRLAPADVVLAPHGLPDRRRATLRLPPASADLHRPPRLRGGCGLRRGRRRPHHAAHHAG